MEGKKNLSKRTREMVTVNLGPSCYKTKPLGHAARGLMISNM